MSDTITIDDFAKLDIRIGRVAEATEVEGSDKLVRCVVDFGELGQRIILSGIKKWYKPEDLVGKLLPYVVNLEPKEMFGEKSQGMLIAAAPIDENGEKQAVLFVPDKVVALGTKII
jgi:methionine--tRNA ligase beta chain